MGKIVKNYAPHWKTVILIFILLVVQAVCDLTLPQYTSQIIDTGIQNNGIEHILPVKMTEEEYGFSTLFMTEDETNKFTNCYVQEGELYVRTEDDEDVLSTLDQELIVPIMINYTMSQLPEEQFKSLMDESLSNLDFSITGTIEAEIETFTKEGDSTTYVEARPLIKSLADSGILNQQQLLGFRTNLDEQIESIGADTLKSTGIAYAIKCNKEAGVDVDKIQTNYLWLTGGKMVALTVLQTIVAIIAGFFAARVGASIGRDLREKVFTNVVRFSNAEIDKFSTASLITRTTNDIQQVQMVSTMMLRMVMFAPIMGVGGVIKVLTTGAKMAWVIALGVLVILGIVLLLMSVAMPKFKLMQKLVDKVNLIAREILTGIPVIRAFKREAREEERFDQANQNLTKTTLFTNRAMALMAPAMTFVMYGITILIVWVASGHINNGTMQVGEMTAYLTYAMHIVMSFLILTVMSIMLPRAAVAAERIDEVVKTESSITNKEAATTLQTIEGVVVFKNVSFKYPNAEEYVLENISFTAKPGETTAIIGSTGSGKSTLINLIPRLYDVTDGEITVDGHNIKNVTMKSLRESIGYVPQKGILFSGTIATNLRFGNNNATDNEIAKAAEIAQATEFIDAKPQKYNSHISQGGTNVSGGQKQRLSIARAIAKNPKIYIFDDSFSALDMKTDKVLREALAKNVKDATTIIVAQRISTILNAEQIIVLDEGKVVGIGNHQELLKTCDEYLEIAKSQLSPKELGINEEVAQ